MELFLWLYFYDSRWLFNLKVSVGVYKYIWIIPIMLHCVLISIGIYSAHELSSCTESLRLWFYHRLLFSFFICVNIIVFMIKISQVYKKENSHILKASKIYPMIHNLHENDYWTRRNSLFSTPGVLLLFLSLISFYWSYLVYALGHDQYYKSCGDIVQDALNIHSFLIWYTNLLCLVVFCLMIVIKFLSLLFLAYFPRVTIKISNLCHRKKTNLKKYFHEEKCEEVPIK